MYLILSHITYDAKSNNKHTLTAKPLAPTLHVNLNTFIGGAYTAYIEFSTDQ